MFSSPKALSNMRIALLATLTLLPLCLLQCHGGAPQYDDQLAIYVKRALVEDPRMNLVTVDVEVSNGVAYLTGEVDTPHHKVRAEQLARNVDGVVDVVSKLRIRD